MRCPASSFRVPASIAIQARKSRRRYHWHVPRNRLAQARKRHNWNTGKELASSCDLLSYYSTLVTHVHTQTCLAGYRSPARLSSTGSDHPHPLRSTTNVRAPCAAGMDSAPAKGSLRRPGPWRPLAPRLQPRSHPRHSRGCCTN